MTHVKTPHPHREMMKAYADDTSLCALIKVANNLSWAFASSPAFYVDCQYFLCLPKHKDAVLNSLNGGEIQIQLNGVYDWSDFKLTNNENPEWFIDRWYMLDEFESRIKPKKVKRWIIAKPSALVSMMYFHTKEGAEQAVLESTGEFRGGQVIEIEIEE